MRPGSFLKLCNLNIRRLAMPKILEATCTAAVVTVYELPVEAVILTQGTAESEGLLLMQDDKAYYVAANTSDIVNLIDSMKAIIDKIILIVTGLDSATGNTQA